MCVSKYIYIYTIHTTLTKIIALTMYYVDSDLGLRHGFGIGPSLSRVLSSTVSILPGLVIFQTKVWISHQWRCSFTWSRKFLIYLFFCDVDNPSLYICLCVYVCACVCMHASICKLAFCLSLCLCLCLCLSLDIYIYIYIYIYIQTCSLYIYTYI